MGMAAVKIIAPLG
jgi:hypothetical protein